MKKTLISTVVVAALAGATSATYAIDGLISASTVEQLDAIEASYDKKALLAQALVVGDNQIRVIIQLEDVPMAQFSPLNPNLSSGALGASQKMDFQSASANEYKQFLQRKQDASISSIKRIDPSFSSDFQYTAAFNGFAGTIDKNKLDQILAMPGVKDVYPDTMMHVNMDASLDIVNAMGAWEAVGGRTEAGRGIKVAIIDSGIRPENPMFSDDGFTPAEGLPDDDYCSLQPDFCNNKLIVARFSDIAPGFPVSPDEFLDTPLAFNGHGTHVAGTAVGNAGTIATSGTIEAEISGVAPAAYLMVYKAFYVTTNNAFSASSASSMSLSALEDALLDGADVVNNSWGGSPGSVANPVYNDVFAAMRDAGVINVFAAGNDGPGPGTIGSPGSSEDVITVANTTTSKLIANAMDVDGIDSEIPAIRAGVVQVEEPFTGPVLAALEVDEANFEGCAPFAEGAFDGSIALISRGSCGFVDKITNAENAGASAIIVHNVPERGEAPIGMGGLSDAQTIPSVMIGSSDGQAVLDLAVATDDAVNATINPGLNGYFFDELADNLANSSSRGPNGDPSFLKPNIAAPGTRIFSAESPDAPGFEGENFSFKTGTSMAAPHVAGAAAILKQLHPDWSTRQIESALVTSSIRDGVLKEDGSTPADNFDVGAGRLDVQRATTAVLTYSDLSMVDGDCFVSCEMTISVTNTGGSAVDVSPTIAFDDPGVSASISPADATLPGGATAQITLSVDVSGASTDGWLLGGVNWTDGDASTTDYFVPVAVFPVLSDDAQVFDVSSSAPVAQAGQFVETNLDLNNRAITGLMSVEGTIDPKFAIDPATLSAVRNGQQEPIAYDAETGKVTWEGALNTGSFSIQPNTSIGDLLQGFGLPRYLPMAAIGVQPRTCSAECDDAILQISMPTITYFGDTYNSMLISSNGFVSLGTASGAVGSASAQLLPGLGEPNNVVAPMWVDLDLDGSSAEDAGAGNIYVASLTTGHFVVEWANAQLYNSTETVNFQIWFEYATGNINFVYGPTGTVDITNAPLGAVVGVENKTGAVGEMLAALTQTTTVGTLPAAGEEYQVTSQSGENLSIAFAGRVRDIEAYNGDSAEMLEDGSVSINVLDNDSDSTVLNVFELTSLSGNFRTVAPIQIAGNPIDASTLTISTQAANGAATANADGSVSYVPDGNFFGEDSFVYQVSDDTGAVASEGTVTVMVEAVNDAPVLSISAPSSVREGDTITITATATDPEGDPVVVTINGAQGSTFSSVAPGTDSDTTVTFTVSATDGDLTTTENVVVTVNNRSGGSMGWIALLLLPLVVLRRRVK